MMAVMIGIMIQVKEDGILSPSSLFFFIVAGQVIITGNVEPAAIIRVNHLKDPISGFLHPQEIKALMFGVVYYVTIPSMYMLLVIYSLFNLNDVSWGTRENPPAAAEVVVKKPEGHLQKILGFLGTNKNDEEGSIDFSISNCFRCMLCTQPKTNSEQIQLLQISEQLGELDSKLKHLEL